MSLYWKHHGKVSSISSCGLRRRVRCGRRIPGRQCPVAEESDGGSRRSHMYRQPDEECDRVLGDYSVEDKLEDVSRGICVARMDSLKAGCFGVVTNHEALLRLSSGQERPPCRGVATR